jgi:plastocyanin
MTTNGLDGSRKHGSGQNHSPGRSVWGALRLGRRETLAVLGAGFIGGLSGCVSGPTFPVADIIAGADGKNVFEPAILTVAVGETVTWGFASAGHNVCCRAEDNDRVGLPSDTEGFASYGPDESPDGSFVPRGDTYEHTLDVPGQYDYVCIPHDDLGMTGTINVE